MKQTPRIIVITGFMGAGKTTVAATLARHLGCESLDLDAFITERVGRTPQEIIDRDGEPHFREVETRALEEAFARHASARIVIALGGGAWTVERNRALINQHGARTVWLDAPFDLCWRRIADEAGTRPLARDRSRAERLYKERRAIYQLTGLRIEADETRNVEQLAAEIATALDFDSEKN